MAKVKRKNVKRSQPLAEPGKDRYENFDKMISVPGFYPSIDYSKDEDNPGFYCKFETSMTSVAFLSGHFNAENEAIGNWNAFAKMYLIKK